ncbi:MAG: cation:proton antiporter [Candidatus Omnitrophota bacterium]|jgi:Kef-type K+ transport system membrane component KefB
MYYFTEENIFIFLIQIFLLLGISRALGEILRQWKQPTLTAEILTGVLLGPTVFGRFLPSLFGSVFPSVAVQQNMLETVAWLGLLFFLLETGLKMDFSSAWRHRGDALVIALTDIAVPMAISFCCSLFLPLVYFVDPGQKIIFCLFMATAMTVSAMPITVRVLKDLSLIKTDLGFLIMSALSVNEIIVWIIFTFILSSFMQANIALGKITCMFLIIVGFTVFCLTAGRKIADFFITQIKKRAMPEPGSSLTFLCLLGLLCGAVFQKLGIHALLGFFVAGVMAGEAPALPERTRQVISQMVYAIFVPLFFAGIGLRIDFFKNFDLFIVLFVTLIGVSARFLGAWLGVGFTKLSKSNRLSIAIAHTPGGSTEIVLGILALQYHLIPEPVFVAIVFGAVISSSIVGPWLKNSINRRKEISVLEFFSKRTTRAEVKALDWNNAIVELCALASEQDNMPPLDVISALVLERESAQGTAVEGGVALPHARFPLLVRPLVIFGRSRAGIEWNSPDGFFTHFIFLILTPQDDDEFQIQILRIIAKTMDDEQVKAALMKALDSAEMWDILQQALTSHRIVRKK